MVFEVGNYYRHTTGDLLHVICEADTYIYGHTMIAELDDGELLAVGGTEYHAVNYEEISREEWEATFTEDEEAPVRVGLSGLRGLRNRSRVTSAIGVSSRKSMGTSTPAPRRSLRRW